MTLDGSRTRKSPVARIAILAGPLVLAGISEQLLGLFDTAIVGRVGVDALGAVSVAGGIVVVPATLVVGLVMGLRILAARGFGKSGLTGYGKLIRSCALPSFAAACALVAVFLPSARPLTHLIAPHISSDASAAYLALRVSALPLLSLTTVLTAAFACAGDSRQALRVVLAVNAVHIPLACVLGLGWLDAHPLGVVGVGLSSVTADAVGLATVVFSSARRPEMGFFSEWSVDLRSSFDALRLGWPEAVNLAVLVAVEPCTIAMFAPGGTVLVAAYRALAAVNDACNVFSFSAADASQIVISQDIGSGRGALVGFRIGLAVTIATACIVALFVAPWSALIVSLLTGSIAVGAVAAMPTMLHIAINQPIKSFAVGCESRLYAEGRTRFVMLCGISGAAFALALMLVGTKCGLGLLALPIAWAISWLVRCVAYSVKIALDDNRSLLASEAALASDHVYATSTAVWTGDDVRSLAP